MRLSKSLFDNAIKALSFCQMGLTGNWINIQSKVHIYASYEMAKFIPWPPDKRRASFFHIVNWFKTLLIRLFTVACKRIRDASRYAYYHSWGKRFRDASRYTSKKYRSSFYSWAIFFLFPFVRQQFPILAYRCSWRQCCCFVDDIGYIFKDM